MTEPDPVVPALDDAVPRAGTAGGLVRGLAVVDVTGTDAEAFLQGQFSNDLVALGAGGAQLTGWCSAKGRLLAAPIVHRLADGFRLVLPEELAAPFVQRLRMFVLRAAVTVVRREDLAILALFVRADDAAGAAALAPLGLDPAALTGDGLAALAGPQDASLVRWHPLRGAGPDDPAAVRLLAIAPAAAASGALDAAGDALSRLMPGEADAAWRLGDVRAGIPSVRAGTREAFVPQMVNFGEAGGLSFRKGCYPGQEIVARMQYLGKLKKHVRRFRADAAGDAVPAAGTALDALLADGSRAPDGGEVVDAVRVGGALELLAVVRIDADGLRLDVGGATADERPLPYEPPGRGEARGRRAAEDA